MASNVQGANSIANTGGDVQSSRGSLAAALNGENPYAGFFKPTFGAVFGRPYSFSPETDPNQRIFQNTLLRNNTMVNIIPGNMKFKTKQIEEATKIIEQADKDFTENRNQFTSKQINSQTYEQKYKSIQDGVITALLNKGIDLEAGSLVKDITGFLSTFQQLLIQAGTATFGSSFLGTGIQELIDGIGTSEKTRGFRLWCEKATSVTESSDNSYATSVFEKALSSVSGTAKELEQGAGIVGIYTPDGKPEIVTDSNLAKEIGLFAASASVLTGAKPVFPKYFDGSTFNRNYELSFKFTSPYGDNLSVFYNVIVPFLFILALALPKQEGVNGVRSPYLMEIDCPGFFCSPMAAIQSLSFRKGGDGALFNPSGLPLVIEGSISVVDMIGSLSVPTSYTQMTVNKYSRSFINNLGGLTLYETIDPRLTSSITAGALGLAKQPTYPVNWVNEAVDTFKRRIGLAQ